MTETGKWHNQLIKRNRSTHYTHFYTIVTDTNYRGYSQTLQPTWEINLKVCSLWSRDKFSDQTTGTVMPAGIGNHLDTSGLSTTKRMRQRCSSDPGGRVTNLHNLEKQSILASNWCKSVCFVAVRGSQLNSSTSVTSWCHCQTCKRRQRLQCYDRILNTTSNHRSHIHISWPLNSQLNPWCTFLVTSQSDLSRHSTRMWANAQRDGCPAEYRWHRLFNAAKFGWRPTLECHAITMPRRKTHWN